MRKRSLAPRASRLFQGWQVVAACFVTACFAWGLGLFGASVYLKALSAAHGWSISLLSGAITAFYLTGALAASTVGSRIDRHGARPVLLTGSLAMAAGVAALGQATSPVAVYVAFVVLGLGWPCLSSTGLSATLAPWFERHQGRATALAITGASFGSIAGVPLLLWAIDAQGVSRALTTASLVALGVLLPLQAWVLRYRRPEDIGLARDGLAPGLGERAAAAAPPPATRAQATRTAAFWSVAIAFALALTIQIGFLTHHVNLAMSALGHAGQAGALVAATGVSALAGRVLLVWVVDRVDVRRLGATMITLQALALAAIAADARTAVLVTASLCFGLGVGMVTTLSPIIVRREFGAQAFGSIYGAAATIIQLTSAFGPGVYGLLRDAFDGYRPGLALASVIDLAAMLVLVSTRPPKGVRPPAAAR